MNDLQQHYKAVRARLWAGAPPPPPVVVRPAPPPPPPPPASPTSDQFREAHEMLKLAGIQGIPKWKLISREVCEKHKVSLDELKGQRRTPRYIPVRYELYYRLRTELQMSWGQIGQLMNRDHSTILYGVKKHESNL